MACPRRPAAALAGVCDTAAGTVTVDHVARLTGRRSAAQGPEAVAAGRLLAAAAAVTPTRCTVEGEPNDESELLPLRGAGGAG